MGQDCQACGVELLCENCGKPQGECSHLPLINEIKNLRNSITHIRIAGASLKSLERGKYIEMKSEVVSGLEEIEALIKRSNGHFYLVPVNDYPARVTEEIKLDELKSRRMNRKLTERITEV